MVRWGLIGAILLAIGAKAQPVGLLQQLEVARTPAEALPLLERLERALSDGELFGEEARIARLTARFWQDPAAPPEVVERLQHIYGMIAPALAVMDPSLAESLFVHVPLTWVTSGDAMRRRQGLAVLTLSWEIFLEHARQEILLQALPSDLALAATWPDEDFEAIVSFLADRVTFASETHLPDSLPTAFVERLRRYRGNYIWKLPEILALDTTETGTNRLIAWAQNPPPPPPSLARTVSGKAGWSPIDPGAEAAGRGASFGSGAPGRRVPAGACLAVSG